MWIHLNKLKTENKKKGKGERMRRELRRRQKEREGRRREEKIFCHNIGAPEITCSPTAL